MGSKLLLAMVGLGAAPQLATPHAPPPALATWQRCDSVSGCAWFPLKHATKRPIGHVHSCTFSYVRTVCRTFPVFRRVVKQAQRVHSGPFWHRHATGQSFSSKSTPPSATVPFRAKSASRTELWLVTFYFSTGNPMANGQMPFVGASACGLDVSLGTRIIVAGLGSYICLDREGFMPVHHADLYDVPAAGSGYRTVEIFP
jgi:hypothetical protein